MGAEPLHIAWIGPPPTEVGGVPGMATLLLGRLLAAGHQVDCFTTTSIEEVPMVLRRPGLRVVRRRPAFRWDRWYSRSDVSVLTFVLLQASRAGAQLLIGGTLTRDHSAVPYDVVYQFSQIESTALWGRRKRLPPTVIHPQTTALGELRWMWRERRLSRRSEPPQRQALAALIMLVRALVQFHDLRAADRVIAPSRGFRDHLLRSGARPGSVEVVANPVDPTRFRPRATRGEHPTRLMYVGRLAVRKGVQDVVRLSRQLGSLCPGVQLHVAGHPSLWSDYSALLSDLDPRTSTFVGAIPPADVARALKEVDVVIVPSHFEPFGLVVPEALACGATVVASDAVGAVEGLSSPACVTYPAGDEEALAAAVRRAVGYVRVAPERARAEARRVALTHFGPDRCVDAVTAVLSAVATRGPG